MKHSQAYRLQVSWDGERFFLYLRSLLEGVQDHGLEFAYPALERRLRLPGGVRRTRGFQLNGRQVADLLLQDEHEIPLGPDAVWLKQVVLWVLELFQDERWFPEVHEQSIQLRLLLDTTEVRQAIASLRSAMPDSFRCCTDKASVREVWGQTLTCLTQELGWSLLEELEVELSERQLECLPWDYRKLVLALREGAPSGVPDVQFYDPRQVSLHHRERFSTLAFRILPPEGDRAHWQIRPQLQSIREPEVSCDALLAWQNPERVPDGLVPPGSSHRFHLLQEFGRALRLFPDLGASLATAPPSSITYDDEEMASFLARQASFLKANGHELLADSNLTCPQSPRLALKVEPGQNGLDVTQLLDFEWNLAIDETLLSKEQLEAWREEPGPLLYSNGRWYWVDKKETLKALRELEKQPRKGTLLEAMSLAGGAHTLSIEYGGDLAPLNASFQFRELDEPESFRGELRDYQRRGFSWLMFMRRLGLGACLADDMGLGKTVQTLAALAALKEEGRLSRALLVCPTSVLGNWHREAQRFVPGLRVLVHHGDRIKDPDVFARAIEEIDLVVTSYPLLTRDRKNFLGLKWDMVVLDEAQQIKNSSSQASRVSRQLEARGRLILTGTPVENRLQDLWSLFRFVQPELLESKRRFQSRFARPIEKFGDSEAKSQLKRTVGPFVLRRAKTDPQIAAELPQKIEMITECSLTPEQARIYQDEVEESLAQVRGLEGFQRRGAVLRTVNRLKQLCDHPALLEDEPDWAAERSGKLHRLYEILGELPDGEGVLIFSQFARMVQRLQTELTQTLGEEVLVLDGSVPKNRRDEMVKRFQSHRGPRLFCISLKAGGVGLNLTRASTVIHIDRWWNPAVEAQATDRAFRIGQQKNVQVFKFVTLATLEEQIDRILREKRSLVEGVIDEGDNWLTDLDDQELSRLLRPTPEPVGGGR